MIGGLPTWAWAALVSLLGGSALAWWVQALRRRAADGDRAKAALEVAVDLTDEQLAAEATRRQRQKEARQVLQAHHQRADAEQAKASKAHRDKQARIAAAADADLAKMVDETYGVDDALDDRR